MEKNKSFSLLSISFKKGFVSPNLPIATFYQGKTRLNFLLDTGSDQNSIDKSVLDRINYVKFDSGITHLTGVGGTQTVESCKITFNHENKEFTADFLITDFKEAFGQMEDAHGIQLHGLIGSNFLNL